MGLGMNAQIVESTALADGHHRLRAVIGMATDAAELTQLFLPSIFPGSIIIDDGTEIVIQPARTSGCIRIQHAS